MPKIFISYRRTDSRTFTDRIHDRLVEVFGADSVFQDVDDIPPGADFRVVLREAVESCDVVLVMIGPQWAGVTDAQGRKRLFNTADFVRIEVQTALITNNLVIPVLIEGASPPSVEDLPESLHELVYRNAINVRHNPDFSRDMERLAKQIKRVEEQLSQQRQAEEQERQHKAELEAQARAGAAEKARQRRIELEAAERERPVQIGATTPQQPLSEPAQPGPLPEAETYSSPAPTPLRWRHFLSARRILVVTGFVALALAGGIAVNRIQKSAALVAQQTQVALQKAQASVQLTRDATILGDTRAIGIGRNVDWTPIEQNVNGVSMVKVPSGCFVMGSNSGQREELPLTRLCFEQEFWIDKTEVTNTQFAQFNGQAANASNWKDTNRPRENITWFEARDFCALRGGRLPTEAEWEYAARGPDGLTYPWGFDFTRAKVVNEVYSNIQTADVGSKPAGASWVGALDMSGNVWEWVLTLYNTYPYPTPGSETELLQWLNSNNTTNGRVLRGGSWGTNSTFLRNASRYIYGPDYSDYALGFRCVVSAPS